jgi:predicted RNA-binding Zn-ribbon protein involved in translation (DUF1610 family)
MSIENRLRRLEGATGIGEPCEACGFDGDYGKLETRVNVLGTRTPGPDRCPECGRVLVVRVSGLKGDPAA